MVGSKNLGPIFGGHDKGLSQKFVLCADAAAALIQYKLLLLLLLLLTSKLELSEWKNVTVLVAAAASLAFDP